MDDLIVFVEDEDSAGAKASKRAIDDSKAEIVGKGAAEGGEGFDAFDAFCAAEAFERKRKISGDIENDGVLLFGCAMMEGFDGERADGRINAGEDIEDFAFPSERGQRNILEGGACEAEIGAGGAHCGKLARGVDGIAFESDLGHWGFSLWGRGLWLFRARDVLLGLVRGRKRKGRVAAMG